MNANVTQLVFENVLEGTENRQQIDHFCMVYSHRWSQCDEQVHSLLEKIFVGCESREHLRGALRVADVGHFLLPGDLPHVIKLSWYIEVTHFNEAEFPELAFLGFLRIKRPMLSAILTSSLVAYPDVIACLCELKSRRRVNIIDNPAVSRGKEAMLEKDDWLLRSAGPAPRIDDRVASKLTRAFRLYPEHIEEIAVLCLDFVAFHGKAIGLDNLLERLKVI